MAETLRPTERLQRSGEFDKVFKGGACFRTPYLRIHYRRNRGDLSRLGLVVTRKMGKAVIRNRLKRILREVYRRNKTRLRGPLDVVLVPQREPRGFADYLAAFVRFGEELERRSGGRA